MAAKTCLQCGKKIEPDANFCKSCGAELHSSDSHTKYVEREWYFFAYLFEFVSGMLIYFAKGQNNKRLAFHSAQSTVIGVIGLVLGFVISINLLVSLLTWVICLYFGFEAYNGNDVEIPYIGKIISDSIGYKPVRKRSA